MNSPEAGVAAVAAAVLAVALTKDFWPNKGVVDAPL